MRSSPGPSHCRKPAICRVRPGIDLRRSMAFFGRKPSSLRQLACRDFSKKIIGKSVATSGNPGASSCLRQLGTTGRRVPVVRDNSRQLRLGPGCHGSATDQPNGVGSTQRRPGSDPPTQPPCQSLNSRLSRRLRFCSAQRIPLVGVLGLLGGESPGRQLILLHLAQAFDRVALTEGIDRDKGLNDAKANDGGWSGIVCAGY